MSTEIDNRIVQMEFRNNNFEKNAKQTMSTLDTIESKLQNGSKFNLFEAINDAANKVSLHGLAEAVENISNRFSNMGIVAMTALQNITNSAMEAGKNMLKSLSTDQIEAGWTKYEQKTASVQTLLNSTGKSMDEINGYLNTLMWFSDETSYGFTDMTQALSTMTASGGDIDKLIPMIMGVANATAFAGKGAAEFSRVMYNLNQSYSSGYLNRMDWKSVELAGAASAQLKEELIKAGEELGKIDKGAVDLGSFIDSLADDATKGWADRDVMERAFGVFAEKSLKAKEMVDQGLVDTASEAYDILSETYDDVGLKAAKAAQEAKTFIEAIEATKDAVSSGWMQTFEYIFGNYEEAKVLWTDLANGLWDIFASGAHARNELLGAWHDLEEGGRADALEAVYNVIRAIGSALAPIKEAFDEIFPAPTVERLAELTIGIRNLTSHMKLSETTVQNIKDTFKGLFSVFSIAVQVVTPVLSTFAKMAWYILPGLGKAVTSITGFFGRFVSAFDQILKQTGILKSAVNILAKPFDYLLRGVRAVYEGISVLFNSFGGIDIKGIVDIINSVKKVFETGFGAIFGGLDEVAKSIGSVIQAIFDKFKKFGNLDTSALSDWAKAIEENIKPILENVSKWANKAADVVSGFFYSVRDTIQSFGTIDTSGVAKVTGELEKGFHPFKALGDFFQKIGEKIKSIVDNISPEIKEKAKQFGNEIKNIWGAITEAFKTMNFDRVVSLLNTGLLGIIIAKIFSFAKMLKDSVNKIDSISEGLLGILNGVKGCFEAWQSSIKANVLLKIAIAIGILTVALIAMAQIPQDKLVDNLSAVVIMIGSLVSAMKGLNTIQSGQKGGLLSSMFSKDKKSKSSNGFFSLDLSALKSTGTELIKMAASVLILAKAIQMLSEIDSGKMWESIGAIVVLMAAMTGLTMLLNKFKPSVSGFGVSINNSINPIASFGMAMIAVSIAAMMLMVPLNMMAKMDLLSLIQGVVGLAVVIGGVLAALAVVSKDVKPKSLQVLANAFLELGVALMLMSGPIKIFANASDGWSWLGTVMGLPLFVWLLAKAVGAFPRAEKVASISTSLILMASAFAIVAASMLIMSPALVILGALAGDKMIGGLLAIAAVFGVLGLAAVKLGKKSGVMLKIAMAMAVLGAGVALISVFATQIVNQADTIPKAFEVIIASLVSVIQGSAHALTGAAFALLTGLLQGLHDQVPTMVRELCLLITEVLQEVDTYVPGMVEIGLKVLQHLFNTIFELCKAGEINPAAVLSIILTVAALTLLFERMVKLKGQMGAVLEVAGVMVLVVGGIGFAFGLMANLVERIPWQTMLSFAAGIVLVTAAFVELAPQMAKLEKSGGKIMASAIVLGVCIGVIGAVFAGLMAIVQNIDMSQAIVFAAGLALIAAVFVPITAGLQIIGQLGAWALVGALVMVGVIAILGAALAGLGALLQNVDELRPLMESGIEVMGLIGEGIGSFIGGIVLGFSEQVLKILPAIGQALGELATNMQPFIDGIKNLDEAFLEGVARLAGALLLITGAELISQISSLLGGGNPLVKFVQDMPLLGKGLVEFAKATSEIENMGALTAAAAAAEMLATLLSVIPKEGGIARWFTGTVDITKFSAQLPQLGEDLSEFSMKAGDLKKQNVEVATEAAKMIGAFIDGFKGIRTGGVMGFINGDIDINHFSTWLPDLGANLKKFADNAQDLDKSSVEVATAAAKMIGEFVDNFAGLKTGGVVQWFQGEVDLSSFVGILPAFGANLQNFALNTKNLDMDAVTQATAAAQMIAGVANNLPSQGGVLQEWFGSGKKLSLSDFAQGIADMGIHLLTFNSYAKQLDQMSVVMATSFFKSIGEMLTALGAREGIADDFKHLGEALEAFADMNVVDFLEAFKEVNKTESFKDAIESFVAQVKSSLTAKDMEFYDMGRHSIEVLLDTMANSEQEFRTVGVGLISAATGAIVDAQNDEVLQQQTKVTGNLICGWLRIGIDNCLNGEDWANTINSIGGIILTMFSNPDSIVYSQIVSSGHYIVKGLTKGIEAEARTFNTAMTKVANTALAKFNKVYQINSPSKIMYQDGVYIIQGAVEGVYATKDALANALRKAGYESIEAYGNGIEYATAQEATADKLRMNQKMASAMKDAKKLGEATGTTQAQAEKYAYNAEKTNGFLGDFDLAWNTNANEGGILSQAEELGKTVGETMASSTSTALVSGTASAIDELAQAVIRGEWGNGLERLNRLTEAGYDYKEVQNRVNEMLGIVKAAAEEASEDINITPTITPVIDNSGIIKNLSFTDDYLATATGDISPSVEITSATTSKELATDIITNDTNNYTEIIKEMENIRSDLADFAEQITSIKMVLDSGTLVGELTPKIDAQLGQRAVYSGRGN